MRRGRRRGGGGGGRRRRRGRERRDNILNGNLSFFCGCSENPTGEMDPVDITCFETTYNLEIDICRVIFICICIILNWECIVGETREREEKGREKERKGERMRKRKKRKRKKEKRKRKRKKTNQYFAFFFTFINQIF